MAVNPSSREVVASRSTSGVTCPPGLMRRVTAVEEAENESSKRLSALRSVARFWLNGVEIADLDLEAAADLLIESSGYVTRGAAVHLCNAFTLSLAHSDADYRGLISAGDLNLADGAPVAALAPRGAQVSVRSRPRGPALMAEVCDKGRDADLGHYLLGGTDEVLVQLENRLRSAFPGVRIVGSFAPPFAPVEELLAAETLERIRQADPHIVWVGLGTPKQDIFSNRARESVNATFVSIGAAIDFLAGTKPMAPEWVQKNGIEWLYRFASEPRRLWHRYTIGSARFLWACLSSRYVSRSQR